MEKKFSIEEVSRLLNIPSDTIRLYQKEDLVTPMWDQNERLYYYGFEQLQRIIGIDLYRQLGIDISEVRSLLTLSSLTAVSTKYSDFIEVTEKEIEQLQLRAEKLRFMKNHIDTLHQGIDGCRICEFPDYYVLYEHPSTGHMFQDLKDVFSSSAFSFGNFCYSLTMQTPGKYYSDMICFIVRKPMMEISPLASSASELPLHKGFRCLYTVARAPMLDSLNWNLDPLMRYADEHNLVCTSCAHAFFVYSLQQGADIVNYYEIYLPFEEKTP